MRDYFIIIVIRYLTSSTHKASSLESFFTLDCHIFLSKNLRQWSLLHLSRRPGSPLGTPRPVRKFLGSY